MMMVSVPKFRGGFPTELIHEITLISLVEHLEINLGVDEMAAFLAAVPTKSQELSWDPFIILLQIDAHWRLVVLRIISPLLNAPLLDDAGFVDNPWISLRLGYAIARPVCAQTITPADEESVMQLVSQFDTRNRSEVLGEYVHSWVLLLRARRAETMDALCGIERVKISLIEVASTHPLSSVEGGWTANGSYRLGFLHTTRKFRTLMNTVISSARTVHKTASLCNTVQRLTKNGLPLAVISRFLEAEMPSNEDFIGVTHPVFQIGGSRFAPLFREGQGQLRETVTSLSKEDKETHLGVMLHQVLEVVDAWMGDSEPEDGVGLEAESDAQQQ